MNKLEFKKLDSIDFKGNFKYDPTSESGLFSLTSSLNGRRKIGDVAGIKTYDEEGRPKAWILWFKGKKYYCHRVILYIMDLLDNEKIVDHIDGNPFNNELSNLKMTSFTVNNKNRKMLKNNTTGITGIIYSEFIKDNKKYKYFVGCYHKNGKEIRKCFNIDKLGEKYAMELAVIFRDKGLIEDLDYSNRHGL